MKRLAAALPKNAADTVFVHEPRYVRYNNVALWSQGPVVPGLPRYPKVRARPLELNFFILAQEPTCAAARDAPRAFAHERKRCDDAAVAIHKIRSLRIAVRCLDTFTDVRQDGSVVFQQSAAVRPDQLLKRGDESARIGCSASKV